MKSKARQRSPKHARCAPCLAERRDAARERFKLPRAPRRARGAVEPLLQLRPRARRRVSAAAAALQIAAPANEQQAATRAAPNALACRRCAESVTLSAAVAARCSAAQRSRICGRFASAAGDASSDATAARAAASASSSRSPGATSRARGSPWPAALGSSASSPEEDASPDAPPPRKQAAIAARRGTRRSARRRARHAARSAGRRARVCSANVPTLGVPKMWEMCQLSRRLQRVAARGDAASGRRGKLFVRRRAEEWVSQQSAKQTDNECLHEFRSQEGCVPQRPAPSPAQWAAARRVRLDPGIQQAQAQRRSHRFVSRRQLS